MKLTTNIWQQNNIFSNFLYPLSYIYLFGYFVYRLLKSEKKLNIPVICVGNIVAGGAGKTPVSIELRKILSKKFKNIFILLRGYKGVKEGPLLVKKSDKYTDVGDESLIHSFFGKTCMSKNKVLGANYCLRRGGDLIIMDDGFQSIDIKRCINILVIDSEYKFGNKRIIPAGPLRQTIKSSISMADFTFVIGQKKKNFFKNLKFKNIFYAKKKISINTINKNLYAFSGLGNNLSFFNSLEESNYKLKKYKEFNDHHSYKDFEIEEMISESKQLKLQLVCTRKDYIKIDERFKKFIIVVEMNLEFENIKVLEKKLNDFLNV